MVLPPSAFTPTKITAVRIVEIISVEPPSKGENPVKQKNSKINAGKKVTLKNPILAILLRISLKE
jgi:hypothetical protein